jgi:transcription initiation factor IIE alpha subunit
MSEEYYWRVRADGYPEIVAVAGSEREAKKVAGYRGKKGVHAEYVYCQATCHEYVVGGVFASVLAERKDPVEGFVCLRCDAHLRENAAARIQKLEDAIVELRRDFELLGEREW